MEITASNLDILFRSTSTAYQAALTGTPTVAAEISTTLPTATRQLTLAFLDRIPQMRKWLGPRVINNAIARSRTITVEPYEDTISLDRDDVEDDNLGLFNLAVGMLGEAGAKWDDSLIANYILTDANTVNGYDGVPLYSASHPLLGGVAGGLPSGAPATQSNLAVSTALTWDNFAAQRAVMRSWVGVDGAPMMCAPTHVMVPPQLEATARQIFLSDFRPDIGGNAAAPQTNTFKGAVEIIVNPWLVSKPNNWFLLDLSKSLKPYIIHKRKPVTMTTMASPTDPNVFMNGKLIWGIDGRAVASESVWWMSLAATSAGAY